MVHNSTIITKRKNLKCGHFDFNFSKGRCKQCATIGSTKERISKHEATIEDESLQNLIADLDLVFSRYIRNLYADKKGMVQCFTCPKILPISEIQNGHYIHREDLGTRFLPDNCRPQCPECNARHNDDKEPFRQRLEAEKKGITDYLQELSREVCKPTRDELKQLLIEYRYKLKLLKQSI